jgi:hypothetical protein
LLFEFRGAKAGLIDPRQIGIYAAASESPSRSLCSALLRAAAGMTKASYNFL